MLWIKIVPFAAICLLTIFAPRSWFLFGQRWTLKDGDEAELSDLYVVLIRASGVIGLAVAVALGFAVSGADEERLAADQERRTSYAWETYTDPPPLVSVPVSDDAEARGPELPLSQMLPGGYDQERVPTLYAVVGSKEADPRMTIPDAADGDLVLKIEDTHDCHVSRVVVHEDPDAVRVAVMYVETTRSAEEQAALDAMEEVIANQMTKKVVESDDGCAAEWMVSWNDEARVVHIPLDEPLGDREVLDLDTGKPVFPVSDEVPEDE